MSSTDLHTQPFSLEPLANYALYSCTMIPLHLPTHPSPFVPQAPGTASCLLLSHLPLYHLRSSASSARAPGPAPCLPISPLLACTALPAPWKSWAKSLPSCLPTCPLLTCIALPVPPEVLGQIPVFLPSKLPSAHLQSSASSS